ncbi:Crp/Fnr family transcriptional regulator [Flavobacterium terrisoli]|uniref:Crp/Fnr family transcriptional regulator n=1 Tax=Flavobacterium terrisoli TaxID=3242195 RepID=UPI002542D0D0|nr:Crp/Fnr family transcriptional regulator [Flavobacterium buctense]
MADNLIRHLSKHIQLTEAEKELILAKIELKSVKKKDLLLKAGEVCTHQNFIQKGCFRLFIINEKGVEQTLQFGIEDWWITDYMSFSNQKPSHFYIQAIENSEIISISKANLDALYAAIPQLERYFRIVLQKSFAASQMRIMFLFTMSAEERYHHFNNVVPEFIQRVPQYMIASYLDFSAELLSKIRGGKKQK